ncbi:DUF4258 domain-containing protein [Azospirillum sp. SYSU D00513]|uniref:DUF4258 domain-containing protein n=1 Tax=Azospirillum sp. SYSU D00513 TaxID=2812561 RepID=UPI001A96C96C|nr:DUF4258 domain-containing protein [Azospirillum sp. SYSU D00513]
MHHTTTQHASPRRNTPSHRPVDWDNPRIEDLARVAIRLADQDRIFFSAHASDERIPLRGIGEEEAIDIIRHGSVYKAEPGFYPEEWKVNFRRRLRGRDAAVAVSVRPGGRPAKILTVMWLDS